MNIITFIANWAWLIEDLKFETILKIYTCSFIKKFKYYNKGI